jgi:alpha-ketoglutarate-dependent taurine dioxygenase
MKTPWKNTCSQTVSKPLWGLSKHWESLFISTRFNFRIFNNKNNPGRAGNENKDRENTTFVNTGAHFETAKVNHSKMKK